MNSAWEAFVKKAIEGEPDDPFVTMLRRTLEGGATVVRVNFEETTKGPEYRILLSRLRQLSVMQIPHSSSFTRWSLGTGTRMASADEEARRFALIAGERFEPIVEELGAAEARAIFVERARALGAPRTMSALANEQAKRLDPGRAQLRATRFVDVFLQSLIGDLASALKYSEIEVAEILDGALAGLTQDRLTALALRLPKGVALSKQGGYMPGAGIAAAKAASVAGQRLRRKR